MSRQFTTTVLFSPGLQTALFHCPRRLKWLVWGNGPIPIPTGIGFSFANTQVNSVIFSLDPQELNNPDEWATLSAHDET